MSRKRVKVDNTTLVRDINSKAILATDHDEYMAHVRRRERERANKNMDEKLNKILGLLESKGISLDDL